MKLPGFSAGITNCISGLALVGPAEHHCFYSLPNSLSLNYNQFIGVISLHIK